MILTPASGDGGIDLILIKDGERILVQCKQYAKPVGPAPIRELYGVLQSDSAARAVLAAPGGVTRGAREFAYGKPISFLGLNDILDLAERAHGR